MRISKAAYVCVLTVFALFLCSFDFSGYVRETDFNWIYDEGLNPPETDTVTLTAVGDLMVHGRQAEDALSKGGGVYNYNHAFSYISKCFTDSDIVIGNLETVLADKYNDYPNFSVTDEFAQALKNAGFDVLTTANNHSLDQREAGLLRTIEVLDSLGLAHTGTFASPESRSQILTIEKNGISFALLSYTYGTNGIPIPEGKDYLVNLTDLDVIAEDITRAKALNPDFVIVFPHMGNEYETYTRDTFKDNVAAMFAAGADIVLASHPHVLQPCETVTVTDADGTQRTCFAAYSMGNFISGQRTEPREAGIIYNLYFVKDPGEKAVLSKVTYVPTWTKFYEDGSALDIAVLPVYDVLGGSLWGEDTGLSAGDLSRVEDVHTETTALISGTAVSLDAIAPEYTAYQIEEGFE